MVLYIVTKFNANWSIFADARNMVIFVRADNSDSSTPIRTIIKIIKDFIVTYILTIFGADRMIFVESKQSQILHFSNSRADNSSCSGWIEPIIELIRDFYRHIY